MNAYKQASPEIKTLNLEETQIRIHKVYESLQLTAV